MITKETIDRIFDAARIDEVVGEFVQLKKRGVNLIGLCPFHNEKTPSFNVNIARNIFKCFGCGKGGTAVNFIMEHEHYTYPEALRWLAKKYNIEIEEKKESPEQLILRDEKESMLVLNSFAQKTFSENLFNTEEGKSIGLTYFKERGFTNETIETFQLGYSLNEWSAFSDVAQKNSYTKEFLVKTGLSIERADENKDKLIDRFKGRVMFPIHNLSGRVIGFGGRVLKKDEKAAKYVNSPESEVYHKSQVLYGIFFAKKSIVHFDNCYLTEGYTDVISLHQAGIENVVASSGTSLTVEQIRLISRYTKNITVLYDADPAGIKASLRGIDMILEEGLNVKVVLFPQGEDPDSFSRSHSASEVYDYLAANAKDFIVFKTNLLLADVVNDPVKKAALIRDVVESIGKIPDAIVRSVYTKQCSALMDIDEQVLISELNKARRTALKKQLPADDVDELMPDVNTAHQSYVDDSLELQEREIVSLLINYGNIELHSYEEHEIPDSHGRKETVKHSVRVAQYITEELDRDRISMSNSSYHYFYKEISSLVKEQKDIAPEHFYKNYNPEVTSLAVELLTRKHFLSSNWQEMHKIIVPSDEDIMKEIVERAIHYIRRSTVSKLSEENQNKIQLAYKSGNDYDEFLQYQKELNELKKKISQKLGIDI